MSDEQLHRTQLSVLHALRYAESRRFSELMAPTGHTSDTFKFHLRKLAKLGYVEKLSDGDYRLTPKGKEYANNLNEAKRAPEKQPKLSALAVVARADSDGQKRYLLQRRARQPFYGYWSEIHGRVQWGEPFEETVRRQLKRQTGLEADFAAVGFRRVRDYGAESDNLLEDKLFVVLKAVSISGELQNTYAGGHNAWLTREELVGQKVFASTLAILDELELGHSYIAQDLRYSAEEY